jgi:hypothetical protein
VPACFFILQNEIFAKDNNPKSLKIAFVDTGYCLQKIKKENIKIHSVIDFTKSVQLDCLSRDNILNSPRYHGQLVIEEFLSFYDNSKRSSQFYPLVVFDSLGEQKKDYWLKAIKWIKSHHIDVVVSAAGLITNDSLDVQLPAFWFVSSGRISSLINQKTGLYPQNLAPLKNMLLIGDYFDGQSILYDQGLLFQEKIDYYFPSGHKDFTGTSRAVAEASAKAINLCSLENIKDCLKHIRKEYIDNISKKSFFTY